MGKFKKGVLKKDEFDVLDETLKPFYIPNAAGDQFVLDLDSADDLPSVAGMRSALAKQKEETNKLKKDLQETIDRYKDIDPAKAKEAFEKLQKLEDKTLLDAGKIEELLATKTERMQAEHTNQIKGFQTQITEKDTAIAQANQRLANLQIETGITRVLTSKVGQELGIIPQAIPDIIRRAHDIYKLDAKTGAIIPYRPDGTIWYGKDPAQAMGIDEWLSMLKPDCPHYFAASGGAGAGNDGKGSGGQKKKRSEMSVAEKAAFVKEHGQDKFFELPA
jgi:hypothetical protein